MGDRVTTDHQWLQLDEPTLCRYLNWDLYSTALLVRPLLGQLERQGNLEFYRREVWPLVPAVVEMARRGIPVSMEERTRLRREFRREVREVDERLTVAAGQPINVNSDTQVRRWLFGGDKARVERGAKVVIAKGVEVECLGLKPAGRTEQLAWSVDKDNLTRVLRDLRKGDEPHRWLVESLIHRSRYVKLDEYLEFEMAGGRVWPQVKMTGTKTLRFAYSEPPVHSWADELRSMVAAPIGCSLVAADYSALEARIFSLLTKDAHDLAVFADPTRDIHVETARELFRVPIEGPKRKAYRNFAKSFRYGVLQYGGEAETVKAKVFCPCPKCAPKLPDTMTLSRAEMRLVTDRWFARHPNVYQWRREIVRAFEGPHATKVVKAPSGWRRQFLSPTTDELYREAYNWPIQHMAWLLMARAQRAMHERWGAPIVLQHHDSFLLEVEEGSEVEWAGRLREVMEQPCPELGGVVFPVEVSAGPNWAELEVV